MNIKKEIMEEIRTIIVSELGHATFPAQEKFLGVIQHKEKHINRIMDKLSLSLTRIEEAARKEEREKIKQAFINVYKGAGEVFFPYVSAGNCTAKEEQMAIEEEWEQIEDNIVTSPSEEKECEHDPIIDCGGNCHCGH